MANQKIGAIWVKKSKKGQTYMSGVLDDLTGPIQIVIFKNGNKEKKTHPDYLVYRSGEKEEGKQEAVPSVQVDEELPPLETPPSGGEEIHAEDLPF